MEKLLIRLGIALLLSCSTALAAEPTMHLYTEEFPPINFEQNGKAAGLSTEIVQEIMRRVNMNEQIEVVPWARGYKYLSSLPNVCLFATVRNPEREKLFKWVGPISSATGRMYTRRGGAHYDNLEAARHADQLLVPREWYVEQYLRAKGFKNIVSVSNPVEAMRGLSMGRTGLIALDDVTVPATMAAVGMKAEELEPGAVIGQVIHYIAFSIETPDEVIVRWQKALDAMKADGTYERIYAKWLPGVKPPGKNGTH